MPTYGNSNEEWVNTIQAIKMAASDVPAQKKKDIRRTNGLKT
jgi:hypothetical protein